MADSAIKVITKSLTICVLISMFFIAIALFIFILNGVYVEIFSKQKSKNCGEKKGSITVDGLTMLREVFVFFSFRTNTY